MDGGLNGVQPNQRKVGFSSIGGYQADLNRAKVRAQNFELDQAETIYIQLLNDESLGVVAQKEINAHIVDTYKEHGDVHYEWQLTALFKNLKATAKLMHQRINAELASRFQPSFDDSQCNSEFKLLSIYEAHLHIASTLGDATSSLSLAKVYMFNRGDRERAQEYAIQAHEQGNEYALIMLSTWCEKDSEVQHHFASVAEIFTVPAKPSTIEILPKEMSEDDPEYAHFNEVDANLVNRDLNAAESKLKEIAERHLNQQEARELFNENSTIPGKANDWYWDRGPIYTRIALKLAKIRWEGLEFDDKLKVRKIEQLVQVINSVGSSEINKAIKLELGEWYLTRGVIRSGEEKAAAKDLLTELNLKSIPDKYPAMQELSKRR